MLRSQSNFASRPQTLLIDADDTLWENNIYFERAIAAFISYLDHREYSPVRVREELNAVEHEHTRQYGYGVECFGRSLVSCFERLSSEPITPEKHERILSFTRAITQQEIEFLPGVPETLASLAQRHRLILMTKGNEIEQAKKLERSGVAQYFSAVEIPREKNPEAYRSVSARHRLASETTWMIGNSPRSDINPALAAGLHAIYIHHPSTWVLEHETIDGAPQGQQLLQIESFARLSEIF